MKFLNPEIKQSNYYLSLISMGKMEKLKEVNENLKNLLIRMETQIFIENINVPDKIMKNRKEIPATILTQNQ